MKNKYLFVTILLLALAFTGFGFTHAYVGMEEQKEGEELLIVTSFYPMYVATLNVAGDCEGVVVENLSEPQTGCLHDYQLTPQDMILLSEADIFVVNGGGIESFLTDVAEESPDLTIINAGAEIFGEEEAHGAEQHVEEYEAAIAVAEIEPQETGNVTEIEPQEIGNVAETEKQEAEVTAEAEQQEDAHAHHNHGENAHVWMSIHHYMEQVEAIRDGLVSADPANQEFYENAAQEYLAEIEVLHQEAESLIETAQGKNIIIFHEAFAYLAEDFGMQIAGELNLDEERQVSAGEVADILDVIKSKKIEILLAEDLYGKDMGDTIEKETTCKVYYLDTLVRGEASKDSWLQGMKQNIKILKTALLVEE